ncbi:polymeric immunoglobulin receptor [Microcaecilia unicolor]|uniref:polymeric immunoglobulin receptor-like n=1 Tax=Microcaecilia unicolor TaxID=1415580 RepID=UPI0011860A8A|nr:polymeric immunoglobulin receptor-like [Microcaecilia unicolor]
MKILTRSFPVWSLMILCPGGTCGLYSPREVRGPVGVSLSLQCQYEKQYKINKKHWCRGETWESCQKLIQTESNSAVMTHRLSLSDDSAALTFTVTMEELIKEDSGKYWCGITKSLSSDPRHPVIVTVLDSWELIGPKEVKGFVGGSVSLKCWYERNVKIKKKYLCWGLKWSSCDILVDTESKTNDRISIMDDRETFTVTMEQLTVENTGLYWCGAQGQHWDSGYPVIVTVLPGPELEHSVDPFWHSSIFSFIMYVLMFAFIHLVFFLYGYLEDKAKSGDQQRKRVHRV